MLNRNNAVVIPHVSSAADVIAETMEYYDITQKDLAERIGVSQKHISDILHRKRFLSEVLALRIEKVMGISSKLLLNMDADYRLYNVKDEVNGDNNHSDMFLKKYDWVSG